MRAPITAALQMFVDRLLTRSTLADDEVGALLALPGRSVVVRTNHDFVHRDETTGHACLIEEGLAARIEQLSDGHRQITALHIPGDMADLHSVVVPHTSWALMALAPTTVVQIPHAALRDLTERYPNVSCAFWRDCVVDASIIAQWTVSLGRRRAISRVAHLLCEMACRYERSTEPSLDTFHLAMAQIHIADVLGLTPIHVNRMYRELRETGLISVGEGKARIADWKRLIAIANFDPSYLHIADPAHS
jgi:CRP-like cAMP-binding protein